MPKSCFASILGMALLVALACGSPSGPTPNPSASPLVSGVEIGEEIASSDHRTISIRFPSQGVTISGSLYLPLAKGRYPAVVWVHGSGRQFRMGYETLWAMSYVEHGFGFFSFDKRGVGGSGGACCPLDFPLLADDARAGVNALRAHPEIATDAVGLVGVSQAGWIVPIAAAESPDIRFIVLQSGPTVTLGEESYFTELTKDADCGRGGISPEEADVLVRQRGPSGFDPRPYLLRMTQPGLWFYGLKDIQQPSKLDIDRLQELIDAGKDFTYIVFPEANHNLAESGNYCLSLPVVDFVTPMFEWLSARTGL